MNSQRIAIITDSGTDSDAAYCQEHDVRIMHLRIIYSDGRTFESGVDITSTELIDHLKEEVPTTSLPSPQEMLETLEQAKADGYERAVIITIASALSATNQTARMISEQLDDFPVLVIDTKSIGMAAGMVVHRCVEYVEAGIPFEHLKRRLDEDSTNTNVYFAVKDLEFLHKGGRISTAIYKVGSVLNIKPVLTCDESGTYAIARKARGWNKSMDSMVKLTAQKANRFEKVRLGICSTPNTDEYVAELEEKLKKQITAEIIGLTHHELMPDLLVHTGPDLMGMGVQGARQE